MKQIKITTSKGEFLVNDNGKGTSLKEITEEQASEIVDLFNILPYHYQDYERDACAYNTAIESLHSLLKSKEITELNNKYIFKI